MCFGRAIPISEFNCKDMKLNPETGDYEHELDESTLDSWFKGAKAPLVQHEKEE